MQCSYLKRFTPFQLKKQKKVITSFSRQAANRIIRQIRRQLHEKVLFKHYKECLS